MIRIAECGKFGGYVCVSRTIAGTYITPFLRFAINRDLMAFVRIVQRNNGAASFEGIRGKV